MKKTVAMVMCTILVLALCFSTFASNTANRVYAETVTVEAGEDVSIPILIENNAGFMGFALFVSYNTQALTPDSVSRGSMLSGMFNDSIAAQEAGQFKIVFCSTGDCKADGVLCTLKFHVLENVSGKEKIKITYSADDTFNEQWQPVELHCEDVQLVITQNGTTAPEAAETETEPEEPSTRAEEPQTEPEPTTVPEPLSVKDSARLRAWFKSLPTGLRILLAGLIYPAIWILSVFGR